MVTRYEQSETNSGRSVVPDAPSTVYMNLPHCLPKCVSKSFTSYWNLVFSWAARKLPLK